VTEFEQELARAMQHGCPFCHRHMFNISQNIAVSKSYPSGKLGIHHGRYTNVRCGDELCGQLLWGYTWGWIPSLAKVVKGE